MEKISWSQLYPTNSLGIKDPSDYIYYCEKNNIRADFETGFITIKPPQEIISVHELALTAHRALFRLGMAIPSWLTDYLDQKLLDSRMIKPPISHSSPELFGLSINEVKIMRDRYLRKEIKDTKDLIFLTHKEIINGGGFYNELNQLNKKLNILKAELNTPAGKEKINIEELKKVPLDSITEIGSNRFFINNPFRNEESPSNSLYWYKDKNRWHDFGTDKNGDVIDFVMAEKKCGFKTACEILKSWG